MSRIVFKFYDNDAPELPKFQCYVQSRQCSATSNDGHRCRRRVVMGLPYCYTHTLYRMHLRILPSQIEAAGKGVFAVDPTGGANEIVFRTGDKIAAYDGEALTDDQLQDRYGDFTAPYTLNVRRPRQRRTNLDAACERSLGSMFNHRRNANAKFNGVGVVIAKRNIRNNEEIFIDYGSDYRFDEDTEHTTKRGKLS